MRPNECYGIDEAMEKAPLIAKEIAKNHYVTVGVGAEFINGYFFTKEEFAIFWGQLCKEQRDLCADEGKKHGLVSAVRNAPEPDIE